MSKEPRRAPRATPLAARGEPLVWLAGSGLALAVTMIVGLLVLVAYNGTRTFWPRPLVEIELGDGRKVAGEVTRSESYHLGEAEIAALEPAARDRIVQAGGRERRRLIRTGNYDLYGEDFTWVAEHEVKSEVFPAELWWVERREWGPAVGRLESLQIDGQAIHVAPQQAEVRFPTLHAEALDRYQRIRWLEKNPIAHLNHELEEGRLEVRRAALDHGDGSAEHLGAAATDAAREKAVQLEFAEVQREIETIRADDGSSRIVIREVGGGLIPERPSAGDQPLLLSQIVRAYPANAMSGGDRVRIYLARWWEFLADEPREANTEGGVFPAIFGTLMMTVVMSLVVAPFGVITALYLREYARQGLLVSIVRIAVNNLAGVPSIVFGVFGLGFFCYATGGRIDALFFQENLPAPTFGTGGILWASLTLALLTVPVVIVSTEEALAAVPRSVREGSLACGASRWQTIQRIVLPAATPGIMTGLILAMARGAGEVAPLMITGVVKLAPELPFDGQFPYIHLQRSFMHLGFHIYDVGFQSRNSEAGRPMVFTTTLLLIALVAGLNLGAILLRARLKRRYGSGQF